MIKHSELKFAFFVKNCVILLPIKKSLKSKKMNNHEIDYKIHGEEFGHLPIHDQVIPWAMAKNVDVIHRADNRLTVEWVVVND